MDKVQKIREEVKMLRNLHQMKYQQLDTNDNMSLVECGKRNLCNELLSFIDSMKEEPVILTEEILKKNGFELNPRPRYKEPFWSELFTASDGRMYYFKINMEQMVETLMTVESLATADGHGRPTCYLPHPKYVQQLQDSLSLFGIKNNIEV